MSHTQIGTVTRYFSDLGVAAVDITEPVALGDELIFRLESGDFVQMVESMQIDHTAVDPAPAGANVAIHVHREVPAGTAVFRAH